MLQPGVTPVRVIFNWKPLPPDTKLVTRPNRFGNPHVPTTRTITAHARAVELYRQDLRRKPDFVAEIREELAGFHLACTCSAGLPCHADVLLAVARGEEP